MAKEHRGIYTQELTEWTKVRVIRECKSLWRWEFVNQSGYVIQRGKTMLPTKTAALNVAIATYRNA